MASGSSASLGSARRNACIALLVLMGFSLGCSEFIVIGIEPELAAEFGVPLQAVGRLISLFALPYAVMTPLLALSTGRFRRYQLLLAYIALFCLGNAVMAFSTSFALLTLARVLIGSVSGALLAVCVTYIPELVSARRASTVLAVVYASFSVAMVIATSLGKLLADALGWRSAMYFTLALALATCIATAAVLPRSGATDAPATFGEQARLLGEPSVLCAMAIFLFGVGSVYIFYGYITPYLEDVLGMDAVQTSTVLMLYGLATLISNLAGGWIESRFGIRALVVTFCVQAFVLLGIWASGAGVAPAVALMLVLGLLMYLASVPCVSLFMRAARLRHPKALILASSLEPMSFNMGIAFGTLIGGITVAGPGIQACGLVGAGLSVAACILSAITWRLSRGLSGKPR